MLSSAAVTQKWLQNTQNAGNALKAGVMAVQTAPTQKAAASLQKFLTNVTNAVNSGKMAAALNGVTLQDWQNAMVQKAMPRISAGVMAAQGKFQTFMDKWLPYEAQMQAQVQAMPKNTLADSQARAAFAIQYNAAYSKRLVGS